MTDLGMAALTETEVVLLLTAHPMLPLLRMHSDSIDSPSPDHLGAALMRWRWPHCSVIE
jgi:hypothetical protein